MEPPSSEIIWTEQAAQDLQKILQTLNEFAQASALKLARRIVEVEDALQRFPHMGKSLAYLGYPNEHKFVMRPYILYYRVEGNTLYILRFLDGRRIAEP